MHLSTYAARQLETGNWVIDATNSVCVVHQLAGVFTHKTGADRWIVEHPAEFFKPGKFVSTEPPSIVVEPQDVLSLHHRIERLERDNALLREHLIEVDLLKEQLHSVRQPH